MNDAQEPRNRAERRARAKMEKKMIQKIKEYVKNHPEAFKVDLDEEAIKEAGIGERDKVTIGGEGVEVGNLIGKKEDGSIKNID